MHTSLSDVNRRLAQLEAQLLGTGDSQSDDGASDAGGRFTTAAVEPVPAARALAGFAATPGVGAAALADASATPTDERQSIAALRAQIDDLLALRTLVAGTLRDVVRQCEAALSRMRIPEAPSARQPEAYCNSGDALPVATAPATAPAAAAAADPRGVGARPAQMLQGTVLLTAGPFTHIGEVSELEHALGDVAAVASVSLLGLEGDNAVLSLALSRPARLVDDLRAALAFPFGVSEAAPGRVTIVLGESDGGATDPAATAELAQAAPRPRPAQTWSVS